MSIIFEKLTANYLADLIAQRMQRRMEQLGYKVQLEPNTPAAARALVGPRFSAENQGDGDYV